MLLLLANWKWLLGAAASVALCIALLIARADATHWHKQADRETALRAADLVKYQTASEQAKAAQIAANAQPAIKSQAIAEQSNVKSQAYYADVRRAAADYARAHLVRADGASGRAGGATDLPISDHAAAEHDGPGAAADMVAVTRADFDTLTGNSVRLAQVHQDAEQLISAGIAVGDDK